MRSSLLGHNHKPFDITSTGTQTTGTETQAEALTQKGGFVGFQLGRTIPTYEPHWAAFLTSLPVCVTGPSSKVTWMKPASFFHT